MGWLLNLNGFFPGQGLCKTATWTQVSPRIIPYHPVQRLRNPEPMDTWEGSGEVAIHALHPVGNIGGIWWIYSSLPWFNILGVYYSTLGGCVLSAWYLYQSPRVRPIWSYGLKLEQRQAKAGLALAHFSPDQPRFQSLFITSPCSEGLELEGVAPFCPLAYHHLPT
jgi:hypothetical protein